MAEKLTGVSERYRKQLADLAGKLVTRERFGGVDIEDDTPFIAGPAGIEGVGIPPRPDGTIPRAV
jgi:hypothetical protein